MFPLLLVPDFLLRFVRPHNLVKNSISYLYLKWLILFLINLIHYYYY